MVTPTQGTLTDTNSTLTRNLWYIPVNCLNTYLYLGTFLMTLTATCIPCVLFREREGEGEGEGGRGEGGLKDYPMKSTPPPGGTLGQPIVNTRV